MTAGDAASWLPLGLLLATMPLYGLLTRGRTADGDAAGRPPSPLVGTWLRGWLLWVLGPAERALVRGRVSPTALNVAGAVFSLLAGAALVTGVLPLAAWLLALGGICDILDGRVARRLGAASKLGAFLDATLDRFAETFVFVGVAWYLAGSPWLVAATVLAVSGSLLVSYTRARGEAVGVPGPGGLAQRAERLVLLALALLADPLAARWSGWPAGAVLAGAVVVVAVASLGTAIYRAVVIARALARQQRETVPAGRRE